MLTPCVSFADKLWKRFSRCKIIGNKVENKIGCHCDVEIQDILFVFKNVLTKLLRKTVKLNTWSSDLLFKTLCNKKINETLFTLILGDGGYLKVKYFLI